MDASYYSNIFLNCFDTNNFSKRVVWLNKVSEISLIWLLSMILLKEIKKPKHQLSCDNKDMPTNYRIMKQTCLHCHVTYWYLPLSKKTLVNNLTIRLVVLFLYTWIFRLFLAFIHGNKISFSKFEIGLQNIKGSLHIE